MDNLILVALSETITSASIGYACGFIIAGIALLALNFISEILD